MPTPPANMKLTRILRELRDGTGTTRRQVVELLKRSRLMLEDLLESALNVLATQDEEGKIVLPVFSCADETRASLPRTAAMTLIGTSFPSTSGWEEKAPSFTLI